jgi:hypothetical protein
MSDVKPSIVLRITWTSPWLTSAETKVLIALASAGDWETGQHCYPKWETLVARSRLSRATVARTLARLENPRRPGGALIVATSRAHRHSTTYDICADRLATGPPKEQQVSLSPLLAVPGIESHGETQIRSESHNETQETEFESQNETPTSTPDLDQQVRTDTHRAREADHKSESQNETQTLPLVGQTPPARCAHPNKHAWCEGRVHVPRDLHFEFLDKLGTQPGESPTAKVGRLIAFYAATMRHLSPEANIGNSYAFWNGAYNLWVSHTRERAAAADALAEQLHNRERITERIARIVAEGRAAREKKTGSG